MIQQKKRNIYDCNRIMAPTYSQISHNGGINTFENVAEVYHITIKKYM